MIRNTLLVMLFVSLLSSCEKTIEYKGEVLDNFMVMNSIISADSIIKCKITRSNTLYNSNVIKAIQDADVKLYKNNQFIETLKNINNTYVSKIKGVVGNNYTIKVRDDKYADVEASTRVYPPVRASVLSIEEGASSMHTYVRNDIEKDIIYNSHVFRFKVKIYDTKGDDYYRLIVYRPNINIKNLDNKAYISCLIQSIDPVLNNNEVGTDRKLGVGSLVSNSYGIFNDVLFKDNSHILQFEVFDPTQGQAGLYLNAFKIDVQRISKELYDNFRTIDTASKYGDGSISEPVQLISNVKGGAGILGSSTSNMVRLRRYWW